MSPVPGDQTRLAFRCPRGLRDWDSVATLFISIGRIQREMPLKASSFSQFLFFSKDLFFHLDHCLSLY